MSLKDLFGKSSEKVVSNKQLQDLYVEAESEQYVEEILEEKERYLPSVDFSSASNFSRYGSAERYYADAFLNIYQNYPYDGSKKEKLEWRNNSTQFDLYVFDNIYPRTTGYVNLASGTLATSSIGGLTRRNTSSPQYVTVKGGPNVASSGKFKDANLYDLDTNRESNLGITGIGNTVEFWYKDEYPSTGSLSASHFCLFDLWNGIAKGLPNYSRLTIEHISSNKLTVTYMSGTAGADQVELDLTFDKSNWHHYAVTFKNNTSNNDNLDVCLYVDGDLVDEVTTTATGKINLANNASMIANIGAYRTNNTANNTSWAGFGVAYGSFDEFRFWKKARTSQEIYKNWHRAVGGGTNTDDANVNLGVYFKFNEGLVGTSTISDLDKICLDYSGRISNGTIVNYSISCKQTGSAIDTYFSEAKEYKDPIIFSTNPLVESAIEYYTNLGYQYDQTNPSSLYKSLPSWIIDDAESKDAKDINYLLQIMSSYFDSLHIQIENLTNAKNAEYFSSADKQKSFAKNLLTSHGFEFTDIFSDASLYEELFSATEEKDFKDKLYNVKNAIYQNIYNNLPFIYKSKGTEKSIRNLIRCFGVDDELIKINLYADGTTYELKDRYVPTSIKKNYVDFNNVDRIAAYVYQKVTPGNSLSKAYISGSDSERLSYIPLTFQTEIIFPKKKDRYSQDYFYTNFTDVSLFGVHSAKEDPNSFSWGTDKFNFQVFAIKNDVESNDVYFKISGSFDGSLVNLTSSVYREVYDNQKWNFAVRITPEKYQQINLSEGSDIVSYYKFEFIGINALGDSVSNQFNLSTNISASNMKEALKQNKRLYIGAHHENFDENITLQFSDVKISSARVWFDYLNNDELNNHAFEAGNYGRQYANWSPDYLTSGEFSGSAVFINKSDTLVLNWTFQDVTASDNNGQFYVKDFSSGSEDTVSSFGYEWLGEYVGYQYTGFGDDFFPNDDQTIQKEYVFTSRKQNPETLNSTDLIEIVETDDAIRTKNIKPYSYFLSIEKSMAQVISDEILNWFATIKNFNNLIGDPAERYKKEYSALAHLRKIFFEQVNNEPSFEKFLEFYKWIDSSITVLINQLVPASANMTDSIRNIVESHILERNKYENKLPTIEFKSNINFLPVQSHLEYAYQEQAAGQYALTSSVVPSRYFTIKPLWIKNRAVRSEELVDTPLSPSTDIDREVLRQVLNNKNLDSPPTLYLDSGTSYQGKKDQLRTLSRTYRLLSDKQIIVEDIINPVNVENVLFDSQFVFASASVTGTNQIVQPIKKTGNYRKPYEYVQLTGRADNNKAFAYADGVLAVSSSSSISGFTDNQLVTRKTNKNIFVERFSAPGGPETNGASLDRDAGEYSAYSSLNYRNYRVRKNLHSWLAESKSINSENPSYHKVNLNAGFKPGQPFYSEVGGSPGSGPIPVYSLTSSGYTLTGSFGQLNDSGGNVGNYGANEQRYVFISPTGEIDKFAINSFQSNGASDKLRIYYNPNPAVTPELPKPHGAGGSSGWSDITLGLNNSVNALKRIDDKLYAGGAFFIQGTGTLPENYYYGLGVWTSGSTLLQLSGGGVDNLEGGGTGYVNALYASGTDLYVGGQFDTVGLNALTTVDVPVTGWESYNLSNTTLSTINAIAIVNNVPYIGGATDISGNSGIAYWNGNDWEALVDTSGVRISSSISALIYKDNYLYFGGNIQGASSDPYVVAKCGRYNFTTNTYELIGDPATEIDDFNSSSIPYNGATFVYSMAFSGSDLYIGLDHASNYFIWKWNGATWSGVGEDRASYQANVGGDILKVWDIAFSGSDIYVGNEDSNNSLMMISGGLYYPIRMPVIGSTHPRNLIINPAYPLDFAIYNDVFTSPLGSRVQKIISNPNGTLDIFGLFNAFGDPLSALSVPITGAARIYINDGVYTFEQLGTGIDVNAATRIDTAQYSGSDLYIGGTFEDSVSPGSYYVMQKLVDGDPLNTWTTYGSSDLKNGSNPPYILDFDFYLDKTIAGGEFRGSFLPEYVALLTGSITVQTPPVSASNIAKYDLLTDTWSALGDGLPGFAVYSITGYDDEIYAGGDWTDELSGNYISKFNGTSWGPVGSSGSLNNTVYSLLVSGTDLYVGGNFTTGTYAEKTVLIWDSSSWRDIRDDMTYPPKFGIDAKPFAFDDEVYALALSGNQIYIGGNFTSIDTNVAGETPYVYNYIAVYDTVAKTILPIGNGFNDRVTIIYPSDSGLYAGGYFYDSGTHVSKWNGTYWSALGEDLTVAEGGFGVDSRIKTIEISGNFVFVGGLYLTSTFTNNLSYSIGRFADVPSYQLLAELSGVTGIDYSTASLPAITTYPYELTIPTENSSFLISWVSDTYSPGDVGFELEWNGDQYVAPTPPSIVITSVEQVRVHDNEYVVHQIPRNDKQYAWISASAGNDPLASGFASEYTNLDYYSNFYFISGNLSQSKVIDYLGLNTYMTKSVDLTTNLISPLNIGTDLNKYLSNINGPYQHPSWKQIRGAENKITISNRKNNLITAQDLPTIRYITNPDGTRKQFLDRNSEIFTSYKEPAVVYNKPMEHRVTVPNSSEETIIVNTYDNNKEKLSNDDLSIRVNSTDRNEQQTHDILVSLEKENVYDNSIKINNVQYSTILYPSDIYVGSAEARIRQQYNDIGFTGSIIERKQFWRNDKNNRSVANGTIDIYNHNNSTYEAISNFTSSIFGNSSQPVYPVLHNVDNNFTASIFALDNATGSSNYFTASIVSNALTTSYGNSLKGLLSPYSLAEHRYFILQPQITLLNGIAFFSSTNSSWKNLDTGLSNVYDFKFIGSNIYASHGAIDVDGAYVRYISKWNGSKWTTLNGSNTSDGFDDNIYTILTSGSNIYLGGEFLLAGTKTPSSIIRYNTSTNTYHVLGAEPASENGVNGTVSSLTLSGNLVIAGGTFDKVNYPSYSLTSSGHIATEAAGTLYDSGGSAANYGNSQRRYFCISPENLDNVSFSVEEFASQSPNDKLRLYSVDDPTDLEPANFIFPDVWLGLGTLSSYVNTFTLFNSTIIAGGNFTNNVRSWDGSTWNSLSTGPGGEVTTLFADGSDLYAGGTFTKAIKKWNGSTWSNMGDGLSATVKTIAKYDGVLYAGGNWTSNTGSHIAKWNGTVWSSASADVFDGNINAFCVASDDLMYVGGNFSSGLLSWDGTVFNGLGMGGGSSPDGTINALVESNGLIICGGSFSTINGGSTPSPNVAGYDFSTDSWYDFPDGIPSEVITFAKSFSGDVYAATDDGKVYILDFPDWSPVLNDQLDDSIFALLFDNTNNSLLAGGPFAGSEIDGTAISNVASYKLNSAYNYEKQYTGTGVEDITPLAFNDQSLLLTWVSDASTANTGFKAVWSSEVINNFAIWNTNTNKWVDGVGGVVEGGSTTAILASDISGDYVYIGGRFNEIYDPVGTLISNVSNVAKFNLVTKQWSVLGTPSVSLYDSNGVNEVVKSIKVSGSYVYVGGIFDEARNNSGDTISCNGLIRWNITTEEWEQATSVGLQSLVQAPIEGIDTYFSIEAINFLGNDLYVGGYFIKDDNNNQLNYIAKWNGTSWSALSDGFIDQVKNIEFNNNILYAGGDFYGTYATGTITTGRYTTPFDVFNYSTNRLSPRPQLVHNNHMPSSRGKPSSGNYFYDIDGNQTVASKRYGRVANNSETVFVLNDAYIYNTDNTSNNKPFFDSYEEFIGDLKIINKEYSIVPEFKISDLMPFYVKEKNGNFNSIYTASYLSLEGSSKETDLENISRTMNNTNILKQFVFEDSDLFKISNARLKINVNAIKKLLPYRGFYPSERIVELASKFINSFINVNEEYNSSVRSIINYNSNLSNGTPRDQQILTLLQPMFAPGILLNTIKSTVAVDYPVIIANSGTYNSTNVLDFYAPVTSAFDAANNYTSSMFINKQHNFRLPFEALVDFDSVIPNELKTTASNLYYLDPTYYSNDVISGSDMTNIRYPSYNMSTGSLKTFKFLDNDYRLAMHNFLAEIPNFFLKNKLSNFISEPEAQFKLAVTDTEYYMDVVLQKAPTYKEFLMHPFYQGTKQNTSSLDPNYLPYSPDSLYGPPTRYWNSVDATTNPSTNPFYDRVYTYGDTIYFNRALDTPAYAPYVPPYYYGKSIARLKFVPTTTKVHTLEEILQNLQISYINTEAEELFKEKSKTFNPSNNANHTNSPAWQQIMKVSSSINLTLKTDNKLVTYDAKNSDPQGISEREVPNYSWTIQTKYEVPSINFADITDYSDIGLKFIGGTKNDTGIIGTYNNLFKGLWTTYGTPVKEGEGILMTIEDSFANKASLADLCGFKKGEAKTLGIISDNKKISETIVLIPYTLTPNLRGTPGFKEEFAETLPEIIGENGIYDEGHRGNGPYYFKINRQTITDVLGAPFEINSSTTYDLIKKKVNSDSVNQDNSIIKTIKSITENVFPPHINWVKNRNIEPFVMYTFTFNSSLSSDDLSDIWQGIMPALSKKATKETVSIEHSFTSNELFHGKRLPNDVRFKIFKVKQQANINYYNLTDDSKDDTKFAFAFDNAQKQLIIPEYSYNYPYDQFSLVELVNVDAKIDVKTDDSSSME